MPLLVFILLSLACVAILAFACACFLDQPAQALERTLAALAHVPAFIQAAWAPLPLGLVLGLASIWFVAPTRQGGRASPALLQRFLF